MSTSQWEVVTKSKKQRNLEQKVNLHTEQKRLAALRPKLEELLPKRQYRNLVLGKSSKPNNNIKRLKSDSLTKSTNSSNKSKSPKKTVKIKHPKTVMEGDSKTPKEPSRPKNLDQAMRLLTAEEFKSKVEQLKLTFPGSELRLLSSTASYFNEYFAYDCDPLFSGKSVFYPSCLANKGLKNALIEFLQSVGKSNLEYFFHTLLDIMCIEMNKDVPVIGYKFLLQIIAQNWPHICSVNMAKTALLRNSYQNRSSIGLSILWAVGQGGYQVLMEGIKVWRNLMLPNMEMRSYTKFIVDYIERILYLAINQNINKTQVDFFAVYDVLRDNYNFAKEQQLSLQRSAKMFLQKYLLSSPKHTNIFLRLLRNIESPVKNRIEIDGCISCLLFSDNDDCFKVWKMNYKKQQLPSVLLLQAIKNEWENQTKILTDMQEFQDFLDEAANYNLELTNTKKNELPAEQLFAAHKSVQEKLSAQQKRNKQNIVDQGRKCGSCRWVVGSILLIALIAGVIYYDTEVNGNGVFGRSATGKFLKNVGLLSTVQNAWYATMSASARGYKWAEKHAPSYVKPAIQLVANLYKLTRNVVCNVLDAVKQLFNAKWPVVAKFVDEYVPGMSNKLESFAVNVNQAAQRMYDNSVNFVKTQVLIGELSPENLNKRLNETLNLATEYYGLFQKKVNAYAKLK